MKSIRIIAWKELRLLFRDGRFWIGTAVLWSMTFLGLVLSGQVIRQTNAERLKGLADSRRNWLSQTPKNAHKAAHFGNFAYRLKTPLSLFDNGLDNYTGTSIYLEPHKSDDFQFSPAEDSTALLRFGELTPAFVLQTILPLLIIFLSFNGFTKEREDSTLRLLLSQGTSIRQLFLGKLLGYLSAFWLMLLPLFALLPFLVGASLTTDVWLRFFLLLLCHFVYTLVLITLSLWVSTYSRSSQSALMKLLGLWILITVILPKLAGNAGSFFYRTPSQYTYAGLVRHDEENGLNGHDPHDRRREVILKRLLKQYQVDTVTALPVNFDAVVMVESEQYTTAIYRKRIGEVRKIFEGQNRFTTYSAFINPFTAMSASSSMLCGTDFLQFTRFQDGAEAYRLYFVNAMNEFMSRRTKSGDWTTPFGQDSFKIIQPFQYREPSLWWVIRHAGIPLAALMFWLIVSALGIITLKTRIE